MIRLFTLIILLFFNFENAFASVHCPSYTDIVNKPSFLGYWALMNGADKDWVIMNDDIDPADVVINSDTPLVVQIGYNQAEYNEPICVYSPTPSVSMKVKSRSKQADMTSLVNFIKKNYNEGHSTSYGFTYWTPVSVSSCSSTAGNPEQCSWEWKI